MRLPRLPLLLAVVLAAPSVAAQTDRPVGLPGRPAAADTSASDSTRGDLRDSFFDIDATVALALLDRGGWSPASALDVYLRDGAVRRASVWVRAPGGAAGAAVVVTQGPGEPGPVATGTTDAEGRVALEFPVDDGVAYRLAVRPAGAALAPGPALFLRARAGRRTLEVGQVGEPGAAACWRPADGGACLGGRVLALDAGPRQRLPR